MLKLGTRPRPRELGFAAPVGRPRLRPTSVETPTLPPASAAPAPTNRPQNRRRPRKNATQTPLATVAEAPSRPSVASKPARKPGVDRSAKSPESPLFAFLTRRRRPSRLPSRNDARTRLRGPTSPAEGGFIRAAARTRFPPPVGRRRLRPTPTRPSRSGRRRRFRVRAAAKSASRRVFVRVCSFLLRFVGFARRLFVLLKFVGFCSEQNLTKIFCSNLLNFVKTRPFFAGFC